MSNSSKCGHNKFDNDQSLREARRRLPFATLFTTYGADKTCPACGCATAKLVTEEVPSGRISKRTVEAVEQADLVAIVTRRIGELKRSGANFTACCPFHKEHTPSFNVQPKKNRFRCFGCNVGGGPIKFVMLRDGLQFLDAVKALAAECAIPIEFERAETVTVFRCTNPLCASGTSTVDETKYPNRGGWDELDFLSCVQKLNDRKAAFILYLKDAGVWKERGRMKAAEPEKLKAETLKAEMGAVEEDTGPQTPLTPALSPKGEREKTRGPTLAEKEEPMIQRCLELARSAGAATVNLFRTTGMSYGRAVRILETLTKRGLLGPPTGKGRREVLKEPASVAAISSAAPAEPGGFEEPSRPVGASAGTPEKLKAEMEKTGPTCNAVRSGAPCGRLPAPWTNPTQTGHLCVECKTLAEQFVPEGWTQENTKPQTPNIKPAYFVGADPAAPDGERTVMTPPSSENERSGMAAIAKQLETKLGVAKALEKPTAELEAQLQRIQATLAAYDASRKPAPRAARGKILRLGYGALIEFFQWLKLSEADEQKTWEKRGFESRTSTALRLRSNPVTNKEYLLGMAERWSEDELLASGLWKLDDKQRSPEAKPNAQFYGAGIMGKLLEGERPKRGQWTDRDRNLWSWCEPILIPYFDENNELISLRPHKGGAPGDTVAGGPHLYVPRGFFEASPNATAPEKTPEERFWEAVILEGEFKGAALWQTLGAGRKDGREPIGVSALPGISFVHHFEVREELHEWLRTVKCHKVIVSFDNEEKADPKYPRAYKADRRKRFDTVIAARYLAEDLARELGIEALFHRLPDAWRDENGKSDWDGALARIMHGK